MTKIAGATLDRLAKGNHKFNANPAEHTIADDARVVDRRRLGLRAPARASTSPSTWARRSQEALAAGRQAHVVHLGDVYYSGDPREYQRRVLAGGYWPVTKAQFDAGVTSWALNGNHDMYSGGYGYFDTMLRDDDRFAKQRSAGRQGHELLPAQRTRSGTSRASTRRGTPTCSASARRACCTIPRPACWSAGPPSPTRKLMLLSHHQLVSAYDLGDLGTVLPYKLEPLLKSGRISAWLWGHEHRCMAFAPAEVAGHALHRPRRRADSGLVDEAAPFRSRAPGRRTRRSRTATAPGTASASRCSTSTTRR